MTYMMSDGLVRRTDDPDWARPALATEAWAFAEIERLRAGLGNIVRTEVLTTVDQIKDYARTIVGEPQS